MKRMQDAWTAVDDYFGELLAPVDGRLDAVLAANRAGELPAIDVSRLQGKFLELLVRITEARSILEIGTLGGYSTIWMARALPADGRIVTLEADPHHAEIARRNFANAGVLDRVELREGPAVDTLPTLGQKDGAPFDLIFLDADKPGNPVYLEWAIKLSRPGTAILTDNVVRDGKVTEARSKDPAIQGTRRFAEMMAAEPRLSATVLQTVGVKGYDGFALAVVVE